MKDWLPRIRLVLTRDDFFPRFKRLSVEMVWLGLGQAASVLASVVGVPLLTKWAGLSPAAYGEVRLSLSITTLVNQVVMGPLGNGVSRFFPAAHEAGALNSYFKALWQLLLQSTLVLLPLGLVCLLGFEAAGLGKWLPLVFAAFCFAIVFSFNTVLDGLQNAARQRPVVAWHQGFGQWLRVLLAITLIGWLGASSSAVMGGYALASAIVLGSQLFFFWRNLVPLLPGSAPANETEVRLWAAQIRGYAWPFASWGIFSWIQQSSDSWALQAQKGSADVGRYGVLYTLGYAPLMQLAVLGTQIVAPVLFRRAGAGLDPARLRRSHQLSYGLFWLSLGGTILLTAGSYFLHAVLFAWMVPPQYRTASWLLPAMVLSGGLFATAQVAILDLLSGVSTRLLIAPKIVTAILGTFLNFAGAYYWGLKGVVYGGLLTSLVYLIWAMVLAGQVRRRAEGGSLSP